MIVFSNSGTIDRRFITSFGVSVKTGENPIGFFGTGLKYAIAVLMRHGCSVKIHSGHTTYLFKTVEENLKGKDFQFIHMLVDNYDGVGVGEIELPFTTELGKKWELWQAFRELYCNATDEGGTAFATEDREDTRPVADTTLIEVIGESFEAVFNQREKFILDKPSEINLGLCSIHAGESDAIYYRGVRAKELKRPSLFTYNLVSSVDLTEDRTIKYDWEINAVLVASIMMLPDGEMLEKILTAEDGTFEASIDFNNGITPAQAFLDAVGRLKFRDMNQSAVKLFEKYRTKIISPDDAVELNAVEAKQLDKAKEFLRKTLAFDIDDFPVYVVEIRESLWGLCKGGNIYLNRSTFRTGGTKLVTSTLLEEYLHAKHGWEDFDRNMQNYLFDQVISLGEQVVGDPL